MANEKGGRGMMATRTLRRIALAAAIALTATPALVSPQMYALQIAAERAFGPGQHDKLKNQVVSLPHPESVGQLTAGTTEITAYFSSAPYTQIVLRNPRIHAIMTSADAFGGKA